MQTPINPEEAVFQMHLAGGSFRSGAAAGRWRAVSTAWPHPIFAVRAADGLEFGLRFDCNGYPRVAPTARLWDFVKDVPLAPGLWPAGGGRILLAFNPQWKFGACIYIPCDRLSIEGHTNWFHEHPSLIWDPLVGIVHYLRVVHELLNSGDYGGRRAA
jgi:hypothetical protein